MTITNTDFFIADDESTDAWETRSSAWIASGWRPLSLLLTRRHPGLLLSGVAAVWSLALEADPGRDISLLLMYATWTALGVLLLRPGVTWHSSVRAAQRL